MEMPSDLAKKTKWPGQNKHVQKQLQVKIQKS